MKQALKIDRRRFLQGSGKIIILPLFESLYPRDLLAADNQLKRVCFIYSPNGMVLEGSQIPEATLGPLQPFLPLINIYTNFDNGGFGGVGGNHYKAINGWLTNDSLEEGSSEISLDVKLSRALSQNNFHEPLLLGYEKGGEDGGAGPIDSPTWANKLAPKPLVSDLKEIFNQIITGKEPPSQVDYGPSPSFNGEKSILDFLSESIDDTKRLLGERGSKEDREKLEIHLSAIRTAEQSIDSLALASSECPTTPSLDISSYPKHIASMFDLAFLAMLCGNKKVATLVLGREVSHVKHQFLGTTEEYHLSSHYKDDEERKQNCLKIEKWEFEQYGKLLAKMIEVKEGETTMLDQSLVIFGKCFQSLIIEL